MCWNEQISLNTFLFSGFVLLLIIYNNAFTQYKIEELNNKWIYLFLASVFLMQLTEFFIWRNIKNKYYNSFFTIIAGILLIIQPMFSIMILSNKDIKYTLLICYLLVVVYYIIAYNLFTKNTHSIISKSGHLIWLFNDKNKIGHIFWLFWFFFFLFSFFYEKKWSGLFFAIATLIISYLTYKNDGTIGSMWCWVVNSMMIFYAFYLLIVLPFLERKGIC